MVGCVRRKTKGGVPVREKLLHRFHIAVGEGAVFTGNVAINCQMAVKPLPLVGSS